MKYLLLALLLVPLIASCSVPLISGQGNLVEIRVTEQGISVNAENIKINNMSPGRKVFAIYRIYNDSGGEIIPEIFAEFNVEPGRYSKAEEYSKSPTGIKDWLVIPKCQAIKSGGFANYNITLDIPEGAGIDIEKWTFRVGAAGSCGGFTQTAVSVWWLIDMR